MTCHLRILGFDRIEMIESILDATNLPNKRSDGFNVKRTAGRERRHGLNKLLLQGGTNLRPVAPA